MITTTVWQPQSETQSSPRRHTYQQPSKTHLPRHSSGRNTLLWAHLWMCAASDALEVCESTPDRHPTWAWDAQGGGGSDGVTISPSGGEIKTSILFLFLSSFSSATRFPANPSRGILLTTTVHLHHYSCTPTHTHEEKSPEVLVHSHTQTGSSRSALKLSNRDSCEAQLLLSLTSDNNSDNSDKSCRYTHPFIGSSSHPSIPSSLSSITPVRPTPMSASMWRVRAELGIFLTSREET